MLIHPQSQLIREPRLLVPGMQPLGRVRIDYGNFNNKHLYAVAVNSKAYPLGFNLITGADYWSRSGAVLLANEGIDTTNGYLYRSQIIPSITNNGNPDYNWTKAFLFTKSSTNLKGLDVCATSTANVEAGNYDQGQIRISNQVDIYNVSQGGNIVANRKTFVVITYNDAVGQYKSYQDGALVATSATGKWFLNYAVEVLGAGYPGNFDGIIHMYVFQRRLWPDAEIMARSLDPYSMFIPA